MTTSVALAIVASYPELKNTPIIIGESDPEGCAACQGPQMAYRNGTMYSSYTAAVFARKHDLADAHHINLEGAVTWAFTFEDQPWFAGFRQIASNGVPMAVFNVFRMYAQMGADRVAATSSAQVELADIVARGVRGAKGTRRKDLHFQARVTVGAQRQCCCAHRVPGECPGASEKAFSVR